MDVEDRPTLLKRCTVGRMSLPEALTAVVEVGGDWCGDRELGVVVVGESSVVELLVAAALPVERLASDAGVDMWRPQR